MRIAIIGLADSCLSGAPVDDSGGWTRRFHMGQDLWTAGATDVFEVHERSHWGHGARLDYLQRTAARVWMREEHDDVPGGCAYPLDLVAGVIGRNRDGQPYLECTAAYMIALAICRSPERIGLWGITGEAECAEQRPNLEYLIAFARARGIAVEIAEGSALLTSAWRCGLYGHQDPKEKA